MPRAALTLRPYQVRIIASAAECNTLVVLPTGAGKTVIAAEVMRRAGFPAVFLVPTVLLARQQAAALSAWLRGAAPAVRVLQGGTPLPAAFDVLVATPAAFASAQAARGSAHIQWRALRAVVFDEAHHVLKAHPYRRLALALRASRAAPRVLALTATHTYAVAEAPARAALQRLCDELCLARLETARDAELRAGGYHAMAVRAEVCAHSMRAAEGVVPAAQRAPHKMLHTFFARLTSGDATSFAAAVAEVALRMELELAREDPAFTPCMQRSVALRLWGAAAHKRAKRGGPCAARFAELEHWYEALRLVVVSWEEQRFGAACLLRMTGCEREEGRGKWGDEVRRAMAAFWQDVPRTFERLEQLKETLLQKKRALVDMRAIVFVQQRITTHVLEHFLRTDDVLSRTFTPASLYAAASPATPSFRVTKTQAQETLDKFATGEVDVLVTTVVAEEGKRSRRWFWKRAATCRRATDCFSFARFLFLFLRRAQAWTCRRPTALCASTRCTTPSRWCRGAGARARSAAPSSCCASAPTARTPPSPPRRPPTATSSRPSSPQPARERPAPPPPPLPRRAARTARRAPAAPARPAERGGRATAGANAPPTGCTAVNVTRPLAVRGAAGRGTAGARARFAMPVAPAPPLFRALHVQMRWEGATARRCVYQLCAS